MLTPAQKIAALREIRELDGDLLSILMNTFHKTNSLVNAVEAMIDAKISEIEGER